MQFIERKTNVKRKNLRKKSVSSIIFLSFSVFVFQQLFISCSSAKKARTYFLTTGNAAIKLQDFSWTDGCLLFACGILFQAKELTLL